MRSSASRPVLPAVALVATAVLNAVLAGCGRSAAPTAGPPSCTTPAAATTTAPATSTATTAPATTTAKLPPETGPGYRVEVRPADFPTSTTIDNPYYPLVPGTRQVFEGKSGDELERTVTEVTRDTKRILGVPTVVVHDRVTSGDEIVEDTCDWFAQDAAGNVWYFGEATRALDEKTGKLTNTAGSWEAGVDGAQPGLLMKAHPAVGDSYYQEYLKGQAEDRADVIKVGERITVRYGASTDTVRTKDYTALEPAVVENKVWARGIGLVYVEHVTGSPETVELIAIERF
jgi:hypothetical protein